MLNFLVNIFRDTRILKPNGIFYFNVPSNGDFHRWPQDCWRFYPDSGNALINWKRNNFNPILLESYVSKQYLECGRNDYVSVTLKDKKYLDNYNDRIIYNYKSFLMESITLKNSITFQISQRIIRIGDFVFGMNKKKKIDKINL